MMIRRLFVIILFVSAALPAASQFISEIIEYQPAPGQLINTSFGIPDAANSIIGITNGMVSLGGFGGYIVFRFSEPVVNQTDNPYGIEFTIFGNPMPAWAEPASVWVMPDENNNNLPDETWYELAGSDYFFSTSRTNVEQIYTNLSDSVRWENNFSESGYIRRNSFYKQPYFPDKQYFNTIDEVSYTLTGSQISGNIETSEGIVKCYPRLFGYADNRMRTSNLPNVPDNPYTPQTENCGGDAFDIAWAVDNDGNYVDLESITFIKVQNAISGYSENVGEISTEITGACLVTPNAQLQGETDALVLNFNSDTIYNDYIDLEIFAFENGRLNRNVEFEIESNLNGLTIDSESVLHASHSGKADITLKLIDNPNVSVSLSTYFKFSEQDTSEVFKNSAPVILPNPVTSDAQILNVKQAKIVIYDRYGKQIGNIQKYSDNQTINLSFLAKGLYFLEIVSASEKYCLKLVKL